MKMIILPFSITVRSGRKLSYILLTNAKVCPDSCTFDNESAAKN